MTEFVPQSTDRSRPSISTYAFDHTIICGGRVHLRRAEFSRYSYPSPPRRTVISDPEYRNPHEARAPYSAPKPDDLAEHLDIDIYPFPAGAVTCHGTHGVRIPPIFPKKFLSGNASGFCKVSFAYDGNGQAKDVKVLSCTHAILEAPTRKSVQKWRTSTGHCQPSKNSLPRQNSTIRFELVDENGTVLPYP